MDAKELIVKMYAMQTHLFNNVLESIDENDGLNRLSGNVNHLRWIAGHLVNSRYHFAQTLGATQEQYPHTAKFTDTEAPPPYNRSLNEEIDYPTLEDTKAHWNKISPIFTNAVSNMSVEQANTETAFGTPIGGKSLHSLLAFLAHHEAYHIGQMSMLRRDMGYDAMSYKQ